MLLQVPADRIFDSDSCPPRIHIPVLGKALRRSVSPRLQLLHEGLAALRGAVGYGSRQVTGAEMQ